MHFAMTILDNPTHNHRQHRPFTLLHVAFSADADFQEGVTSSIRTNKQKLSGLRLNSCIDIRFVSINFVEYCCSAAGDIKWG